MVLQDRKLHNLCPCSLLQDEFYFKSSDRPPVHALSHQFVDGRVFESRRYDLDWGS